MMISAVVLTKNEEKNLQDCLGSIKWCDEILVIDDNSTDKTIEIAKKYGARVFIRSLNNSFAQQRNFGLKKAKGEWVLFLDADERISKEFKKEILKIIDSGSNIKGFYFRRNDFFGNRWLKHGETARVRLLRLAKKDDGQWEREIHEVWMIKGRTAELKNRLLHYPHTTISDFLKTVNFYSTLHARSLKKEGVKAGLFRLIFNPVGKFFQSYILRLGFLDGMPGLITALMMSFHSFLARGKLFNL